MLEWWAAVEELSSSRDTGEVDIWRHPMDSNMSTAAYVHRYVSISIYVYIYILYRTKQQLETFFMYKYTLIHREARQDTTIDR